MFWLRYGLPVCCVQSVRGLVQYRHRMLIALAKHGAARPNPTTTLPCSFTRLGLLTLPALDRGCPGSRTR